MFKTLLLPLLLICMTAGLSAQKAFPTPDLVTVSQQPASLADFVGNGNPTVIAVWATWCMPCHMELDHMKSYLDKWKNEYGARFVAVSVDQRHMMNRINPLVKRKGWKYDILVDTEGKLQGKLGFRSIPQMYILDGDGKIVKSFTGYEKGREAEVDRVIRKLAAK